MTKTYRTVFSPSKAKMVMHGLKRGMQKEVRKKQILGQDDSHNITQNVLSEWKIHLKQLMDVLAANEGAWQAVFTSYGSLQSVAEVIYTARDVDARACLKDLQTGAISALNPPKPVEPEYNAPQKVELAKQEINTLLSRIANAEALHGKRFEATREWLYYDRKTKGMLEKETGRNNPASNKEVERRTRNQQKVMDLAINLNSVTTQLYSELEYIDMERLAVTDRVIAAVLQLQKFYTDLNPSKDAVLSGTKIRLGHRVVPRDEVRAWMPQTLQPADPNPAISNPNLMQAQGVPPVPPPPASAVPPGQLQQAYPPGAYPPNGEMQAYPPQPPMQHAMSGDMPAYPAQPPMQHAMSAPTAPPPAGATYAPPQYNLPPAAQPPSPTHQVSISGSPPTPVMNQPPPPGTMPQPVAPHSSVSQPSASQPAAGMPPPTAPGMPPPTVPGMPPPAAPGMGTAQPYAGSATSVLPPPTGPNTAGFLNNYPPGAAVADAGKHSYSQPNSVGATKSGAVSGNV